MPVTIKPSPDKAGRTVDKYTTDSTLFLCRAYGHTKKNILHSSFSFISTPAKVVPLKNGFVNGIIRAYQQDLHLILRPGDVWLAIITQFSFYVSGHAEETRGKFVSHAGKLLLDLENAGPSFCTLDVGHMSHKLTCLIEEKLF